MYVKALIAASIVMLLGVHTVFIIVSVATVVIGYVVVCQAAQTGWGIVPRGAVP